MKKVVISEIPENGQKNDGLNLLIPEVYTIENVISVRKIPKGFEVLFEEGDGVFKRFFDGRAYEYELVEE